MTHLEAYVNMIKSKLPQLGFNVIEGGQIAGQDLILSAMCSKNMKSLIGLPTFSNVQIYIYAIFRPNLSIMDYTNFVEHCFQYFEATVPKQGLLGKIFSPKPCAVIPLIFSENIEHQVISSVTTESKAKWGKGVVLPYVVDAVNNNIYTLPNAPFVGKLIYQPAQETMNWLFSP